MSSKVQELRERRAKAHAYAIAQLRLPQTSETRDRFDKAIRECDELQADIQRYERAGYNGKSGYEALYERDNPWTSEREVRAAFAFGKYLRKGSGALDAEENALLRMNPEQRAEQEGNLLAQLGTWSGLGFFVPAGFVYDVEVATKWYANLIEVCGNLDTATGNPMPYPTSNDTSVKARIVGESTDATPSSTDLTAGNVIFGAWKYTTDVIKVTLELLQDSAFNLEAFIAERMGIRLGRAYENDFTVGTGASQPTGVLTDVIASGVAPVIANGSAESSGGTETGANSIGYTDLVRLEHSVDPSYRKGARFMFHDATLSQLKRILDKFGRPLWVPGMKEGAPDTINGYPYVINQSMPQIGAAKNTVIFGDLKKFMIRRVKGLVVQRLSERYAEAGQVAFVGFARADSRLVDAGTHPLNLLQQHS